MQIRSHRWWRAAVLILAGGLTITAFGQGFGSPQAREMRQERMADMAADRVLSRLHSTPCDQLVATFHSMQDRRAEQGQHEPPFRQRFQELVKRNPEMRQEFVNRVAGPLVNRMFDCGLIP